MGGRRQGAGGAGLTQAAAPHWAEVEARRYLEERGWRTLATNYSLRAGELDLVMEVAGEPGAPPLTVFVEVKQRSSTDHGSAADAISSRKLAAIRLAANHYLAFQRRDPDAPARIDAVLIEGTRSRFTLRHVVGIG